jgi:hypothetical protein
MPGNPVGCQSYQTKIGEELRTPEKFTAPQRGEMKGRIPLEITQHGVRDSPYYVEPRTAENE